MSMMLPPGLGAPPQGPPPGHPPSIQLGGGQDAPPTGDAVELLKQALDTLNQAMGADADPAEDAAISAVAAKLKTIIASRHKEKEAALGTSPALKHVQRASSGGSGSY